MRAHPAVEKGSLLHHHHHTQQQKQQQQQQQLAVVEVHVARVARRVPVAVAPQSRPPETRVGFVAGEVVLCGLPCCCFT